MPANLKDPLEQIVKKILEEASVTGVVSKEQLALILLYQNECKKEQNTIKDVLGSGQLIMSFIEGILG